MTIPEFNPSIPYEVEDFTNPLWYPKTKEVFKAKRQNRPLCILCAGQGMLPDAKTKKIRECKCCDGSGRMKSKK